MSDAKASRDLPPTQRTPLLLGAAGLLALAAAGGLWWRFGEGVYGRALLDAIIACF